MDHLGWVVSRSYEIAGMIFGVRTNSTAVGAWLDETLGDYGLTGEDADPYYSILVGENGKSLGKRFHILYRESKALIRTFDLAEIGRVFFAELERLTFRRRNDAVYVQFPLVTFDGVAALIPAELPSFLDRIARKVAGTGLSLPQTEYSAVDLDSAMAIPVERSLAFGDDDVARLARLASADGAAVRRWEPEGPLPVNAVCMLQHFDEIPVQPLSRAVALHGLIVGAVNLGRVGSDGFQALGRLVDGALCYRLMADLRDEMLSHVVTALEQVREQEAIATAPT